jgi:hypothetical protein
LDYAEYGGAPLIGLDGVAIIAHGGSSPLAIKNAIRAGRDAVEQNVNLHITQVLGVGEAASDDKKDGLPQKIWQRIKSKIESVADKPAAEEESEEPRQSGKG